MSEVDSGAGAGASHLAMFRLLTESMQAAAFRGMSSPAVAHERRQTMTERLAKLVGEVAVLLSPRLVLEVGAHDGGFSLNCKERLPAARVIAFEANPTVHARYHARLHPAGVEYLNLAVQETASTALLKVPVNAAGGLREHMGSLLDDGPAEDGGSVTVEVPGVALDGFLGADAGRDCVLWIDVEGATAGVLAGATRTLSACRMVFVEVETTARWAGQATSDAVIATLARYGLHPVLRDFQRTWQYNALFLDAATIMRPDVQALLTRYVVQSANLSDAVGTGSGAT